MLNYLRTGQLVTQDLSAGTLIKLKLEADYFGLKGLKDQIEELLNPKPSPDDEIVIDARGTKVKTTRKVITKGKDCRWSHTVPTFCSLFDPQSPKLLQAEDDGSYKIDADPRYVEELLLALCECKSEESARRVLRDFHDKYGFA